MRSIPEARFDSVFEFQDLASPFREDQRCMDARFRYRKKSVYISVAIIVLTLMIEVFMMVRNSRKLEKSLEIQQHAELARVSTVDIIRNIHLLDLALRGYALSLSSNTQSPMDSAAARVSPIFNRVENSLKTLNYPLKELDSLKAQTFAYVADVHEMRRLITTGEREKFMNIFSEDRGYHVWFMHRAFSERVTAFCQRISDEAKSAYAKAQREIYLVQLVVLIIVVPTLLYTAYFSNKTVDLAHKLRVIEQEKADLLSRQNESLEHAVSERTQEILTQNEEITAQNEEILSHNEQLTSQQQKIEEQALLLKQRNLQLEKMQTLIYEKNLSLSSEIEHQTASLRSANKELLEHNARLEQFAYIISHNLRAPIARLIGLTSIADTSDQTELEKILGMIHQSSTELDGIVRDLTAVLSIQRLSPTQYSNIVLAELVEKLRSILGKEIAETRSLIETDLQAPTLFSLNPYVESILLNLISNAIKYRHPDRTAKIIVRSRANGRHVHLEVEDNGIGIDLTQHKENLFNLYKRFHFHVEGKGLGLYLVKTQIEALGGTVTVKSEIERGTTFEISFPITPVTSRA